MVKIFISIINYNGNETTNACLDSLEEMTVKDFSLNVIVIDNASKIPFEHENNFSKFKLEIIKNDKNLGFSGGQNLGIKKALEEGADYIVVLNNDIYVDKNLIVELLQTFSKEKDCGLVSPKIYFAKGYEFHKDRYKESDLGNVIWYGGGKMDMQNVIGSHTGVDQVDKGQFDKLTKTDFASGCCVMIKKDIFASVGFFDEKYFLYYEDNDLSVRAKRKGYYSYYQPKAFMWHLNAGSSSSGSELHDYYITRNRLLFGLKYANLKTKLALIKESLKILNNGRVWQKKGVLDFYKGNLGKGSFLNG